MAEGDIRNGVGFKDNEFFGGKDGLKLQNSPPDIDDDFSCHTHRHIVFLHVTFIWMEGISSMEGGGRRCPRLQVVASQSKLV